MKCLRSGSSAAFFFRSSTSSLLAERSSGERSGDTYTSFSLSCCFRSLALVRICCTAVELVSVTFTGLQTVTPSGRLPIRTAANWGFSPISTKTSHIFSLSCSPSSSASPNSENHKVLAAVLVLNYVLHHLLERCRDDGCRTSTTLQYVTVGPHLRLHSVLHGSLYTQ